MKSKLIFLGVGSNINNNESMKYAFVRYISATTNGNEVIKNVEKEPKAMKSHEQYNN